MLTDMRLRALKPTGTIYKVADQQGLYVAVTRTGVVSFRFDYRINGRRETLVLGQYDSTLGAKKPRDPEELDYGMSLTLAEARLLMTRARRSVERGESPSRDKAEKRVEAAEWAAAGSVDTDLSFLSFLELYRTDVAERRMPARRVVEALDVVEHVGPRLLSRPVHLSGRALGLQ